MGALIGGGVATLLSLFILSRAIADNPLYRLGQNLLIGAALGYVTAALIRSTIVPPAVAVIYGQATPREIGVAAAGLVLGLLLVTRFGRQRGSHWANYPLALLFGVGAALALVGAVRGTLTPQLLQTVRSSGGGLVTPTGDLSAQVGDLLVALLAIITLLGFTYTLPRSEARDAGSGAGGGGRFSVRRGLLALSRVLVLFTFGVFFAATVTTYINALVGQVGSISNWVSSLLGFPS
jgi:hypothetical protein